MRFWRAPPHLHPEAQPGGGGASKSHIFPHFCLLDRYLMHVYKLHTYTLYYIHVNDFSALSHAHNFNTVNIYKSVIDFGAPE